MNKYLALLFFIFLGLAPWACRRPLPVGPNPIGTPTPTPTALATSTPVCVGYSPSSSPTTIVSGGITLITHPLFQVSTIVPAPGNTFVIHNLTEWQALFGSANPPAGIDFNTQMIVGGVFSRTCGTCPIGGDSLASVCEDSTQVTAVIIRPTLSAVCYIVEPSVTQMLVVPQSNLPFVWLVYTNPGC
jgi:hypothetical protein